MADNQRDQQQRRQQDEQSQQRENEQRDRDDRVIGSQADREHARPREDQSQGQTQGGNRTQNR